MSSREEVRITGSTALARLGLEFSSQWPSFKFMGWGAFYAWVWLDYNSGILCSSVYASDEVTSFITSMYLSSTAGLSFMLIFAALCWRWAQKIVDGGWFPVLAGLVAGVSTLGVVAFADGSNPAVLYLFSVFTGIGTAWVALRLGDTYSHIPPRQVIMQTAASFVFACLLYFVVLGLPHVLGVIATASFPVVAALLTLLPDSADDEEEVASKSKAGKDEEPASFPTIFFLRLVLAIGIFALVIGVTRGSASVATTLSSVNSQGAAIVFGTALICVCIYLFAGLLRFDFKIDQLYYPVILLATAGILLMPIVGVTNDLQTVIVGVAYALFTLFVWSLLSHVAWATGLSPVRVFGWGRGASAFGATLGWLLGGIALPAGETSSSEILMAALVMVFAILVVALLLFNDRIIGQTLHSFEEGVRAAGAFAADPPTPAAEPEQGGGASDAEAAAEEGEDELAAEDAAIEASLQESRPRGGGLWVKSCNLVANRYQLTKREREVLFLLAKGYTIESIAEELKVSFNTSKTHIRHVYVKTDVHTRQELLALIEHTKVELEQEL